MAMDMADGSCFAHASRWCWRFVFGSHISLWYKGRCFKCLATHFAVVKNDQFGLVNFSEQFSHFRKSDHERVIQTSRCIQWRSLYEKKNRCAIWNIFQFWRQQQALEVCARELLHQHNAKPETEKPENTSHLKIKIQYMNYTYVPNLATNFAIRQQRRWNMEKWRDQNAWTMGGGGGELAIWMSDVIAEMKMVGK